jgi:hypothetical protein
MLAAETRDGVPIVTQNWFIDYKNVTISVWQGSRQEKTIGISHKKNGTNSFPRTRPSTASRPPLGQRAFTWPWTGKFSALLSGRRHLSYRCRRFYDKQSCIQLQSACTLSTDYDSQLRSIPKPLLTRQDYIYSIVFPFLLPLHYFSLILFLVFPVAP